MKKYFFIVPIVLLPFIILLFYGCPSNPSAAVEKPTITVHTATNEGADLQLQWTDNTEDGSDIFYLYSGAALVDSTTNLTYTFDETNRNTSVGVTAWLGDDESGQASLDLSLTTTSNLEVYSTADPDSSHHSFVKFNNISNKWFSNCRGNLLYVDR
ncbi:MAG: hypothetical protein B5M53_05920 [Candidatus Cloacimonas sp. 4484_209]|nr:MAG: hypothetical protein B5M53_05920 [Candidatus Cloacimonas sp. 4484_209]